MLLPLINNLYEHFTYPQNAINIQPSFMVMKIYKPFSRILCIGLILPRLMCVLKTKRRGTDMLPGGWCSVDCDFPEHISQLELICVLQYFVRGKCVWVNEYICIIVQRENDFFHYMAMCSSDMNFGNVNCKNMRIACAMPQLLL